MLAALDYFWRLIPGNPILRRVVESAAKRNRDLAIRLGYLGVLVVLVLFRLLRGSGNMDGQSLTQLGKLSVQIFEQMSVLQLALVALLAPIFTAGAITQEKDSQTYDILLATPLSNAQIVFGSLLSRLFFVIALLVSGIPVFAITQIFGSVGIGSIAMSFMIAASTACVTGALAMAIATFKVGTRRTIFSFYLFIIIFLVGGYLLDKQPQLKVALSATAATTGLEAGPGTSQTSWLTAVHPFLALEVVFDRENYRAPDVTALPPGLRGWPWSWYWTHPASFYVWSMLLLSLALVVPSIIMLRRVAQSSLTLQGAILQKFGVLRLGRARKARQVWSNPIAWREARTKASASRASLIRYGFAIAGLAGAGYMLFAYGGPVEPTHYVSTLEYDPANPRLTVVENGRGAEFRVTNSIDIIYVRRYGKTDDSVVAQRISLEELTRNRNKIPLVDNPFKESDPDRQGRLAWSTQGQKRTLNYLVVGDLQRATPIWEVKAMLLGAIVIELAAILLIVSNAAASTVTREREDGTLDLLLSTPITSRYYIWGKLYGLVSYTLPLLAVPVLSVLGFVLYDLWAGDRAIDGTIRWIVLPESLVVLPLMLTIVVAFAAILGMQMSLRARTTVVAVILSVSVLLGVTIVLGGCGYLLVTRPGEATSIGSRGPALGELTLVLGAFSPFTLISILVDPVGYARHAFSPESYSTSRVVLFVSSMVAVGAYVAVVWAMYRSMVKNFDMTIRRNN